MLEWLDLMRGPKFVLGYVIRFAKICRNPHQRTS
jgi:hypothetical protein